MPRVVARPVRRPAAARPLSPFRVVLSAWPLTVRLEPFSAT
ncbi:hypothetical protein APASM_1386 [Actinosynnema pretiosum subsp. pretiosum]|nr:hypothetical protein APASM_1386 [Actinosynnema pretiosum subsp. pretiosum]